MPPWKISIGARLQDRPYGGGNQFAWSLTRHLRACGWSVSHDLDDPDLDLVLLTDPRRELLNSAFTHDEIWAYQKLNPRVVVVHRINECDERKGTVGLNDLLVHANRYADHTVFISSWLRDLFVRRGVPQRRSRVILNGADASIFRPDPSNLWDPCARMRLVTHHWGGGRSKGYDVYEAIDARMAEPEFARRFEFTIVGNIPGGVTLSHTRHVAPLSGEALAGELRRHHVYVTAATNEPAGMHHIEGAMCGLPVLYRESGALPEYCRGFGLAFSDPETFFGALERMAAEYGEYAGRMHRYPNTAERMCRGYEDLFGRLIAGRARIRAERLVRRVWRVVRRCAAPAGKDRNLVARGAAIAALGHTPR